jgi:nucleoid-associated protein YgaU
MSMTSPISAPSTGGGAASMAVGSAGAGVAAAASYLTAYIEPLPPAVIPIVKFQFNPETIKTSFKGEWSGWHQTASNGPQPQWRGITPDEITVPITLDAFSLPRPGLNISTTISILRKMVLPIPATIFSRSPVAPQVIFGWGANVILPKAIVKQVDVTYKRFLMGVPIRADVSVRLAAVPMPVLGNMNPTSGGLARQRTHVVGSGDSLQSIAFASYGNPSYWRALAIINGIDDPMRLKLGRSILVPEKSTAKAIS